MSADIEDAINSNVTIDEDTDVVIKSEYHSSKDDIEEELALLRTGAFDAVVFEAARENVEEVSSPDLSDRFINFPFFFLGPLYTDSTPLIAAASATDTEPFYTRETDGDIIQDLPKPLPTTITAVGIALILSAALFGAPDGPVFQVSGYNITFKMLSLTCFVGAFSIPITIRTIRNRWGNDTNRNQIVADRIRQVHTDSDAERTLVILGNSHSERVENRLPDDLKTDVIPISRRLFSVSGLVEFVPKVSVVVVAFVGVWMFVEGFVGAFVRLLILLLATLL